MSVIYFVTNQCVLYIYISIYIYTHTLSINMLFVVQRYCYLVSSSTYTVLTN